MNMYTTLRQIESSFKSGELAMARKLIEDNKKWLISPAIRTQLSSDVKSLLDHIIKEEEKDTNNRENKISTFSGNEIKVKRNLEKEIREFKEKEQLVHRVNMYCEDLNWRRAKDIIDKNPDVFAKAEFQAKLSSEAKVIFQTITKK